MTRLGLPLNRKNAACDGKRQEDISELAVCCDGRNPNKNPASSGQGQTSFHQIIADNHQERGRGIDAAASNFLREETQLTFISSGHGQLESTETCKLSRTFIVVIATCILSVSARHMCALTDSMIVPPT